MVDFAADSSIFLMDSPHSAAVGGESAQVIYDAPFKLEQLYEGQVETSAPACSMLDSDLVRLGVRHGAKLSIFKSQSLVGDFEVVGIQPDGLDMTRLSLSKDF
jgi:hypothetical protein